MIQLNNVRMCSLPVTPKLDTGNLKLLEVVPLEFYVCCLLFDINQFDINVMTTSGG